MSLSSLRQRVLCAAASISVIPALVALDRGDAAPASEVGAPRAAVTTSTTDVRAIEVAMNAVTTTTTAPPAPVTTLVTAPQVTTPPQIAAPRPVIAASRPLTLQERGEQAVALLNYPWERLGYRIEFQGPMPGLLGETNSTTKVITIFIRDKHSAAQIARTLAHEMGHALDFSLTTIPEARQYLAIRGLPFDVANWYPCNACTDFSSPAGDFAETFAYYLLGPGDFRSEIAGEPTPEQLTQLSAIFSPS